jgi:molybdopterin/thiamine biosynthesis adenylyltransferase
MKEEQRKERYMRQKDIVPANRLAACRATVIGVGAIGRQVALQLTAMGISWLQLVDFDTVDASNLASQGYLEADFEKPKVEATARMCKQINTDTEIHWAKEAFRRSMEIGNVVFCAVDRIQTRRLIWEATHDKIIFFTDGRMSAEVLRIITAYDSGSRKHYPTTLFRSNEAFEGSCTAKTTIYCANIAAGLMIAQFTKYLRQLPIDCDIQLNLLASELTVAEIPELSKS